MRVVVEFLPKARDELLRLLAARSSNTEDGIRAAIVYCDEITRLFEKYEAPPPNAVLRPRGETGSWWLFTAGLWVAFTREDHHIGPRPFAWRTRRTFTVLAFATRPTDARSPR